MFTIDGSTVCTPRKSTVMSAPASRSITGLSPGVYRYSQMTAAMMPGTACGRNSPSWAQDRSRTTPESSSRASARAPVTISGM